MATPADLGSLGNAHKLEGTETRDWDPSVCNGWQPVSLMGFLHLSRGFGLTDVRVQHTRFRPGFVPLVQSFLAKAVDPISSISYESVINLR